MKKVHPFLLLASLMLTCCSNKVIEGKYSFIMGKESSTHVGAVLNLKDRDYVNEHVSPYLNAKKFDFSLLVQTYEDETIRDIEDQKISFDGYYYLSEDKDNNFTRINLGTVVLSNFFTEQYGLDASIHVPPELFEKFVSANFYGSAIKMRIPTSLEDLRFQMYWLGYKVDLSTLTFNEVAQHKVDTHPNENDIATIREIEKNDDTFKEFRDYYVLEIELKK